MQAPSAPLPPHDPDEWLVRLQHANSRGRAAAQKLRKEIIRQGRHCLHNGCYSYEGKAVLFGRQIMRVKERSVIRVVDDSADTTRCDHPCDVIVCAMDCIEAAIKFGINKDQKTVVLVNGASDKPGDGPQGAQESNLHRRSNLSFAAFEGSSLYPIPQHGCLYHPDVLFYRGSEATGYPFFKRPIPINLITAAAIKLDSRESWDPFIHVEATEKRIRSIFQTCLEFGCETIILSAHGCGALNNPPHIISGIFKSVLQEKQFAGKFKRIVFAIIEDRNSQGDTGKIFASTFSSRRKVSFNSQRNPFE